jgi:thioredoxin 1
MSVVTVFKFYTNDCQPCKAIEPHLAKLAAEFPNVTFLPIDANGPSPLTERMGISSVPTLVFVRDGEIIDRLVGSRSYNNIRASLTWALAG